MNEISVLEADGNWSPSDGVLSDASGEVVIKPCKQAEIDFYTSTSSHPNFALYIPTYMGQLTLDPDPDPALVNATVGTTIDPPVSLPASLASASLSHAPMVENAWAPSNGGKIKTDLAIVLENIAATFKHPNILDVKLGARLWADDAPPAKRSRLDKVAEESTSKELGLKIAGMRIWLGEGAVTPTESTPISNVNEDGISITDNYKLYSKSYGRTLTPPSVRHPFEDFFRLPRNGFAPRRSPTRKVINRFLEDLEGLKIVIESEESRIYGSSLLFVYEGDEGALGEALAAEKEQEGEVKGEEGEREVEVEGDGEEEDEEEERRPAVQALKLIDFAHAEWTPGQGRDENMLLGIRSTIRILDGILDSNSDR